MFPFPGHVVKILANRQVFRKTEYGSDVFPINRIPSTLPSSYEKSLGGPIGHRREPVIDYSHYNPLDKCYAR